MVLFLSFHHLAFEGGGGAVGHFHLNVLPGLDVVAVEHDDLVLAVAAKELLFAAVRLAFHQHFEGLAYLLAVVFEGYLPLQGDNLFQPAGLLGIGHIVLQVLGGVGVGTHGEFEHIGVVVAHLAEDVEGLEVVFLGLGAETGDDIGGDGAVGHVPAYGVNAVQIPGGVIVTVHEFQHPVAAALHRQMDALADVAVLRHHFKQFVAQVLGV